jgi:hypothetical protein
MTNAARRGEWSEDLVGHLHECDECGEAILASGATLLRERTSGPAHVDPVVLWWKGLASARLRAIERATRPGATVQLIVLAAGAVAAAAFTAGAILLDPSLMEDMATLAPVFGILVLVMAASVITALRASGARSDRPRPR